MTTLEDKLRKQPYTRATTLAFIARRNETTERLRREIEAGKRIHQFRDEIGYVPWWRGLFGRHG